jgi:hypothetical protein
MLYTPVPYEDIFLAPGLDGSVAGDQFYWQEVAGRLCQLRRGPDGRIRLERLLSTDPKDYLDARFAPGHFLS